LRKYFKISQHRSRIQKEDAIRGSGARKTLLELTKPSSYKPFLLLMVTFALQQSTGTFAIIFYAVNVFKVCRNQGCQMVYLRPKIPIWV
jgi:hypothetical protein